MSAAMIMTLVRPDLEELSCKFEFVYDFFKDMAGGEHLGFSNSTFLSERSCANRNNAIAYFMRENKCFPGNVDIKKVLDFYFQVSE
jgi:glutaminase